ncbi:hypothetical protein [Sanguibacter antarcticus]|uniref:Uncharacterized protein n=1 Tax=Sanguibacter antarcticus TaxID=372484 RepID=A0A2A9E8A5_9MICO|nr:hypothetical protein [Sanguibacter antarcticus]PFG35094.1 hypothetical protein ATL42_3028 [Sanguibacter antarcticus]
MDIAGAGQSVVDPTAHVCLVYHYTDGHDFTTESMLEGDAIAYMPVLDAHRVDDHQYVASFATIELRTV